MQSLLIYDLKCSGKGHGGVTLFNGIATVMRRQSC